MACLAAVGVVTGQLDRVPCLEINQANRGTANAISFAGFENLIGSTADDNFQVADGGSIESMAGGAGENQLSYSARTAPVTVNLATLSSTGVTSFADIDAIVGTEFSDTLIGPDQVNTWNILQNNAGDIEGATTFSSFENLTGNQQSDNFRFSDGASISGTLSGGAGRDTLDASAHTAPVNINLQSLTSSTAGSIASIENFKAGTAGGTLTGPNTANTWNVQSSGTGDLNSAFTFVGFDSLEGGTGQDVFHYHANNLDITDPHLGILPGPNGSVALQSMEELHVLDARAVQVSGGASNDILNVQTTGPNDFTYSLNSSLQVELHRPDSFTFDALGGDDSFHFDHSQSGLLQVPGSIHVHGGDGQDIVTLVGTGSSDWHEVFSYGDPDLLAIHQGNASLGFSFVSIENIHDSIPVAELSIFGTPASETITYSQGHTADFGAVFTDNRARFDFSNKQKLLLRAGAGDDVFVIDNATNPVGLIEIQAEGEDGNDEVRILAALNVPTTSFNAESIIDTTLPQETEEEAEEENNENEEESSDESTDEESSDDTGQEQDTGSETGDSDSESQTEDDTETSGETTDEEASDDTEQDQEEDAGSEAQSEESETDGNVEPVDDETSSDTEAVEDEEPSPEPIAPEEPQRPEPVSDNTPQRPEEILPAPRPQIPERLPEQLSDEQPETPVTQDRRRELIRTETSNVEELRGVQFSRTQLEALILFRPSRHQSEANNTATFEEAGFAEERALGPDEDLQPKPLRGTERATEPEKEAVPDTEIATEAKEPDEEDDSKPEERKKADQPDSELSFNLDRVESKGFRITPSLLITNQESGTPTQN